ncbi:hypothetical protein [Nocardia concava]|uniref:hypothetical protein n=1 Tax=Nocardia concava TaxID=257281 RepID=UPI0012FA43A2|nr:hypothetical protein [Nocardia concava]
MTTTPPAASTTPMDAAALPLCGDVKASGSDSPPDCKLISRDRAALTFIVRHTVFKKTDKRDLTIDVVGGDGKVRQTIHVLPDDGSGITSPAEPTLRNLADDGRDQLVVPLSLAMSGNARFTVYRATDAKPDFDWAGDVSGFGVDRTTSGYIAAESKNGAAEHYTDFWHFVDSPLGPHLKVVAGILRTFKADGSSICVANDQGVRGDSGLSDEDLARKFCAEELIAAKPVG